MIEVTDEMVQLALDIFLASPTHTIKQIDDGMAKALAAVLALIERDHDVSPKLPPVEHRPKGDIWWNLSAETYMAECVCGEEFSGWPRSDAEERLLTHLEREARP